VHIQASKRGGKVSKWLAIDGIGTIVASSDRAQRIMERGKIIFFMVRKERGNKEGG
jgi:hypothetical protein